MAEAQETDTVKMLLSKEGDHLVVEYLVTGNDHTSEQCRDWHAANLSSRKHKRTQNGDRYFLKIECGVPFQAKAEGSDSVGTMNKEDASAISKHFFRLPTQIFDNGESSPWPWEFCLEEEYDWSKWSRAINSETTARSSGWRNYKNKESRKSGRSLKKVLRKLGT